MRDALLQQAVHACVLSLWVNRRHPRQLEPWESFKTFMRIKDILHNDSKLLCKSVNIFFPFINIEIHTGLVCPRMLHQQNPLLAAIQAGPHYIWVMVCSRFFNYVPLLYNHCSSTIFVIGKTQDNPLHVWTAPIRKQMPWQTWQSLPGATMEQASLNTCGDHVAHSV